MGNIPATGAVRTSQLRKSYVMPSATAYTGYFQSGRARGYGPFY